MKGHLLTSAILIVLVGCGSAEDQTNVSIEDLSQNPSSRIVTSAISAGEEGCESGGVKIDMGFDKNDNSILDSDEIADSYIVCNGSTGGDGLTSLIKLYDEEQGSNCSNGGKRIVTGVDLNSDNLLSSNEVQDTQYLCNSESIADAGCSVEENLDGSATISCSDGTSTTLDNNSGRIHYQLFCYGELDGVFTGTYWSFNVTQFGGGDGNVYLDIDDGYISVSTMQFWPDSITDNQPEISGYLNFDPYMNANHGYWELTYSFMTGRVGITFYDNDLIGGQKSWLADASDCTLYDFTTP